MLACLLVVAFRIAGNLYSVGEGETTSYLFATPQGHILLDAPDAEVVLANVRKLGFEPKDIKFLLNSQAHFDHAGGFARLKEVTGAKLEVMDGDAQQIERGGLGDFAFGDRFPYKPAKVDKVLHDGDVVELGGTRLTAIKTPGHTRGCTTWTATIDGKRAVFLCSVTAPGYELTPPLVAEFRASFKRLAALPCDLFLGSHTTFFQGNDYRDFVEKSRQAFEEQVRSARR